MSARPLSVVQQVHAHTHTHTHTTHNTHARSHAPTHPLTHTHTHTHTHTPTHPPTHTHPRTHAPSHPPTPRPTHTQTLKPPPHNQTCGPVIDPNKHSFNRLVVDVQVKSVDVDPIFKRLPCVVLSVLQARLQSQCHRLQPHVVRVHFTPHLRLVRDNDVSVVPATGGPPLLIDFAGLRVAPVVRLRACPGSAARAVCTAQHKYCKHTKRPEKTFHGTARGKLC